MGSVAPQEPSEDSCETHGAKIAAVGAADPALLATKPTSMGRSSRAI